METERYLEDQARADLEFEDYVANLLLDCAAFGDAKALEILTSAATLKARFEANGAKESYEQKQREVEADAIIADIAALREKVEALGILNDPKGPTHRGEEPIDLRQDILDAIEAVERDSRS